MKIHRSTGRQLHCLLLMADPALNNRVSTGGNVGGLTAVMPFVMRRRISDPGFDDHDAFLGNKALS